MNMANETKRVGFTIHFIPMNFEIVGRTAFIPTVDFFLLNQLELSFSPIYFTTVMSIENTLKTHFIVFF